MLEKIDKTVLKETKYIAAFTVILSAVLQAVYLICGRWDYTVLLGNILSGAAAAGNFFVMGLTVQKAVNCDEKQAQSTIKASQSLRMVALFAVAAVGVLLDCFNTVAVILPLFFPRIAIAARPFIDKRVKK